MSDRTDTNNGNGKQIEHRLTALEVSVNAIMNNHLPHIQSAIADLKGQLNGLKTWLIGLMGGIIVSLVLLIINLFKNGFN